MKRMNRITAVVLVLGLFTGALAGCSAQPQTSYDSAGKIADLSIQEFLAFTEIPRPGHHTEKALAYLQDFATTKGYEHFKDDYGNFWMDIPATEGHEDY
ncbi:MAG: hypothetical protein RSC76_04010, partial [Oscillospiraceae bacterium]